MFVHGKPAERPGEEAACQDLTTTSVMWPMSLLPVRFSTRQCGCGIDVGPGDLDFCGDVAELAGMPLRTARQEPNDRLLVDRRTQLVGGTAENSACQTSASCDMHA
ncbi:hypothetical protein GCM10010388_76880 [Streptomyces mauvecolor]